MVVRGLCQPSGEVRGGDWIICAHHCQDYNAHMRECAFQGIYCTRYLNASHKANEKPRKVEKQDGRKHKPLTENQKHILRLVSGGMSSRGIARLKGVGVSGIDSTLRVIQQKMGVDSRYDAIQKWKAGISESSSSNCEY